MSPLLLYVLAWFAFASHHSLIGWTLLVCATWRLLRLEFSSEPRP